MTDAKAVRSIGQYGHFLEISPGIFVTFCVRAVPLTTRRQIRSGQLHFWPSALYVTHLQIRFFTSGEMCQMIEMGWGPAIYDAKITDGQFLRVGEQIPRGHFTNPAVIWDSRVGDVARQARHQQ